MSLAELRLVNTVDLCDRNALGLESGSSFLVVGSEVLAVTAPMKETQTQNCVSCVERVCYSPWGKELDEDEISRVDGRVKIGRVQLENV